MIIPGDIATLIDFFGFTSSIFYCAAMVALIVMRFTKKNEHRPIKVYIKFSLNVFTVRCLIINNFLIHSGTYNHPLDCYGGLSLPSHRTHCSSPTSAILLCPPFHPGWTYFLRTIRLLQDSSAGNEYCLFLYCGSMVIQLTHFLFLPSESFTIVCQKILQIAPTTVH